MAPLLRGLAPNRSFFVSFKCVCFHCFIPVCVCVLFLLIVLFICVYVPCFLFHSYVCVGFCSFVCMCCFC